MYLFTKNDIAQTNLMQNISFTKLMLYLENNKKQYVLFGSPDGGFHVGSVPDT